jgi:SHS2 domain-containing protein
MMVKKQQTTRVPVPAHIVESADVTSGDAFKGIYDELRAEIKRVSAEGVSIEDAERLAAKFLDALLELGGFDGRIRHADLDVRMKKNGYKTLRAKVYLQTVQGQEKKPTESAIEAAIATNTEVSKQQDLYEKAETDAEALHRIYDVFRDCHIYFRGVAKGNFSGI